ncbi:MAG: SGNH/GDSL hydrolase family protein [Propionibacterium sp.]|nr:SGNH/GDSL hydrolase family protein [Propionibacterium sp.]
MKIDLPQHPITWLFVGDSITHGWRHTDGARSYVEHVNETLRHETGRARDVLVNTGVSGARVGDLLEGFDFYAARFRPDVVFVLLGTNDSTDGLDGLAEYSRGLTEIVDRFVDGGAQVVLQVPPPLREAPSRREHVAEYRDVVRELARSRGLLLVDHDRDWTDAPPAGGVDALLNDDIHPNAAGHRRMADAVLAALGIS